MEQYIGKFVLHVIVYFKGPLACILKYRRGFFVSNPFEDWKADQFSTFCKQCSFTCISCIEWDRGWYSSLLRFIFLIFYFCALLSQTKTGIALLYDEVSENAYDIRLKLTKEVLTIQKQDVVCVSGSDHSANVSASVSLCFWLCTLMSSAETSLWYWSARDFIG